MRVSACARRSYGLRTGGRLLERFGCPEVADAAAVFFDPYSTGDMARAITDLVLDQELRARMERLGLRRAAHFSWRKTAEMMLEIYREVASRAQARARPLKSANVTP